MIFNYFFFHSLFNCEELHYTFLFKEFYFNPWTWEKIKNYYSIVVVISWILISISFYNKLSFTSQDDSKPINSTNTASDLSLTLGKNKDSLLPVIIPEKGLYQNVLITGTIGTGKTSSAIYPFIHQLLKHDMGMLILDVKGNLHIKVKEMAKKLNKKVRVIELSGKETYNPLDKPHLKPSILANRLRTILSLFSNQNATDTYWMDKVELYLTECIKLCRMYNDNYVTFTELHKLIYDKKYLKEKIEFVKNLFLQNKLNYNQTYDFSTCIDFFQSEFQTLDSKVLSIIQSEISRITQLFINDLDVKQTFCPNKEDITFNGFENLGNDIVVLNMNVAEYRNLAKVMAAYLKLDFQSEILMKLAKKQNISTVAFVCDEYSEYATENDASFFSQSR